MTENYVNDPNLWWRRAREAAKDIFYGQESQARVLVDRPTVEGLVLRGVREAQKHYHIGEPLGPGD